MPASPPTPIVAATAARRILIVNRIGGLSRVLRIFATFPPLPSRLVTPLPSPFDPTLYGDRLPTVTGNVTKPKKPESLKILPRSTTSFLWVVGLGTLPRRPKTPPWRAAVLEREPCPLG